MTCNDNDVVRRVGQSPVSGSRPSHFLSRTHMNGFVMLAFNNSRFTCICFSHFSLNSSDNDKERQRTKSVLAIRILE